jgi:HAD-superfamily hydrolase, subfamily IIB
LYRLIAIDIDDTLLTDDGRITDATREALAEAARRGVTVTLATGRMFASASRIAERIGLNVPIITYQGALVKMPFDGKVLYERNVPADAAREILAYARRNNLHLQLYTEDELYAAEDNDKVRAYAELSAVPYRVEPDFDKLIARPQSKMLIIDDPDKLDRIADELRPVYHGRVHITKSKPHFLEFLHPEATKGHALAALARHVGCVMEQTIAVGDSWNDREMIEAAGLGVAMGNAIESLKAVAGFVTKTNNEDGVKHVIDTFILNPLKS